MKRLVILNKIICKDYKLYHSCYVVMYTCIICMYVCMYTQLSNIRQPMFVVDAGGPRFSPQSAPRQALSTYLRARGQSSQDVYLHGNPGAIPPQQQMHPAMIQKQQQLRQKLRQQQQQAYMNRMGGTEAGYGQQQTQQPSSGGMMQPGMNYQQMAAQGTSLRFGDLCRFLPMQCSIYTYSHFFNY